MPFFPLSLGSGSGFVFVFCTHHHTHGVRIFVHGQQKRTITIFKLLVKIFFLATDVKSAKTSVSRNGEHLSFRICKKKKNRIHGYQKSNPKIYKHRIHGNFEKYRLMTNGCQKIYKHQIHGCRKSNPKIYKHRIHGCRKSNHKLYKLRILHLKTNKHQFSSWKSTLKTHPSDKSCNLLRVCIKQRDATFSDCLCSRAPIRILFSQTIIEDFLHHFCIFRIFFTTAYIWEERSNHFEFHVEGFVPSIAQDKNDDTTPSIT